jgi:hypothetical protein
MVVIIAFVAVAVPLSAAARRVSTGYQRPVTKPTIWERATEQDSLAIKSELSATQQILLSIRDYPLLREKLLNDALTQVKSALMKQPNHLQATLLLARVHDEMGDAASATVAITTLFGLMHVGVDSPMQEELESLSRTQRSMFDEAALFYAHMLWRQGNLIAAESWLRLACLNDDSLAFALLAELLQTTGRQQQANLLVQREGQESISMLVILDREDRGREFDEIMQQRGTEPYFRQDQAPIEALSLLGAEHLYYRALIAERSSNFSLAKQLWLQYRDDSRAKFPERARAHLTAIEKTLRMERAKNKGRTSQRQNILNQNQLGGYLP